MTQGATETEDLRRRLEVAETELKLVLEASRGQKEVEKLTAGSCGSKEGRSAPTSGAGAGTVQSLRSGRKSRRGDDIILCVFLKISVEKWLVLLIPVIQACLYLRPPVITKMESNFCKCLLKPRRETANAVVERNKVHFIKYSTYFCSRTF